MLQIEDHLPDHIFWLVEAASQLAHTDDFGTPEFRPALWELYRSIYTESQLVFEGLKRVRERLVGNLMTRAAQVALVRRHPEILEIPLRDPIFIVGLPRTGTTMLQNVMGRHPQLRTPLLWELRNPVPPEGGLAERAAWEARGVASVDFLLEEITSRAPHMDSVRSVNSRYPDECSWLFHQGFATLVNAINFYVPSYVKWMYSVDMEPYYRYYRRQLQILQWQRPTRRLLLKDPLHLWFLPSLRKVFPDSYIVQIHRRVDEALPSLASLSQVANHINESVTDPAVLAPYCYDMVAHALDALPAVRASLGSARFVDIEYKALVTDARGAVSDICKSTACSTEAEALKATLSWLDANPQHKHGRHGYTLEQFGYNRDELQQRFATYHQQFLPSGL